MTSKILLWCYLEWVFFILFFMRTRKFFMDKHHDEMVERIKQSFSEEALLGIIVHGGYSNEPRHLSDTSSDLDFTVVLDGSKFSPSKNGDPRAFIPSINFKSYQLMEDLTPIEVDMYYFDINDDREWDLGTREGYAYSTTVVHDPYRVVESWLQKKAELTPELRNSTISCLMHRATKMFNTAHEMNTVDKNITLTKVVKALVEVIFYINWEYPPDQKWRTSATSTLEWRPDELITLLRRSNQTIDDDVRLQNVNNLFTAIRNKLDDEGDFFTGNTQEKTNCKKNDTITMIARHFTRIDKYSYHSVFKCIRRGLPWNAHDLISTGVDNLIDIIYLLNDAEIPTENKFAKIKDLSWTPKGWQRFLYQAALVSNYEDADDARERAEALRRLYIEVKKKIEEKNLFATSSLYAENFMNEELFTENSPYMIVFKDGGYINRQQQDDTFAVKLLKKVSLKDNYEYNLLCGMCSQYLIADEDEFKRIDSKMLNSIYRVIWEKVVSQL